MEEQEEMEMLESVLLLLMDLSALELCPTAGVQDRGIQVRREENLKNEN